MRGLVFAVALAAVAGCDTRATASDPPSSRGEQRSREYESCGGTAQCQDELRCLEHVCRRAVRSTVGDYHAAAGALARNRGDVEGAIASYAHALAQYDAEKVALPPDLDCAYGAALGAGRANKEHAELAARVLHRCVLAVPAGSRLREQALAELAALSEVGLDPLLLGASKLADLYITKAAIRPSSDRLTVVLAATPTPTGKSYALIPEKLGAPEIRSALIACWDAFSKASKKDALTVSIGVKVSFLPSDYEDEPGTFPVKLEPPAALPAGSPEAAADACVRQVVEPAIKGLKLSDAFSTRLAIAIK